MVQASGTGQRAGSEGADFSSQNEHAFRSLCRRIPRSLVEQLELESFVVIEAGSGPDAVETSSCPSKNIQMQFDTSWLNVLIRSVKRPLGNDKVYRSTRGASSSPRNTSGSFTGVVLANELLDNLPRVVKKTTKGHRTPRRTRSPSVASGS